MAAASQPASGKNVKFQSAIEYIMTYGWVVLIVAVLLLAGFQLGIFTTTNFYGNVCVASTSFFCSVPVLSSNGNLTLSFGQATGSPITLTSIGCSNTTAEPVFRQSENVPMSYGTTTTLTFECGLSSSKIGTPFSGTLWITYNTPTQVTMQSLAMTVQATVATKASPAGRTQPISQSAYADLSHSFTASFPSQISSGDMIVAVFAARFSGSCTPPVLSDSLGNSWTTETSECNQGGAGNKYQYSSISYATASSSGTEAVTASTGTNQGILVIYDLSPAPASIVAAIPGSGITDPGIYTTGELGFASGSALIAGISESSGGNCCVPGTGFSIYGVGVGYGSEFSNTISSPSDFPIFPTDQGTNGWSEVGAAFQP